MPAPASVAEFLDFVQKSGVADDSKVTAYLQRLATAGQSPADPKDLALAMVRDGVLTAFQAEQLLQGKWKRFFIGKYKVLERLGSGGMGQVFLCEHKLMRRRVAVKVLPTAKAADPASLERFYREARAVAAVDHPNIVRAYDIDQDENLHFLVMEYVDGANLQDLVKKAGPLDPIRAAHYIYGSAVGLQHAHEMGLIHRDIKPGNILVDRAGAVKILDLGLARFFHDTDDALTRKFDENVLGTADYLAPEQALDSHTVDIRADVYALGATFYFLLTGRPPFPDGTVAQKLLWHQTREPQPVRSLRPDCPPDLADLIARMMAKDVAARPQVPADVMAALAPWVQGPLAPPSDRELPTLSPAASGGPITVRSTTATMFNGPSGGGPGSVVSAIGGSSAAGRTIPNLGPQAQPAPGFAAPSGWLAVARSGARTTPAPAFAPTPAPALPRPTAPEPAAFQSAPVYVPPPPVWNPAPAAVAPEPVALTADAPTPVPAPKPIPPKRRGIGFFVGLGLGAVLLAGAGAGLAVGLGLVGGKPAPTAPADGARRWYVGAEADSPDPTRTLKTLKGALDQARPGDVIVLLGDLEEGPVLLFGKRQPAGLKGVRIESRDPDAPVTWTAKAGSPAGTGLLSVQDAEDVKVTGLVLDCNNAAGAGLVVAGNCPGVVIDRVTVRAPKTVGVRVQAAAGTPDRPVRITNVRVTAGGDQRIEAAFGVSGVARYLVVENGRFRGPGDAGVRVDGYAQDAAVRNCRVADFDNGVRLVSGRGASADSPFGLTVANCTFVGVGAGVRAEVPLGPPKRQVSFTKNYFGKAKELFAVGNESAPGLTADGTAKDTGSKDGRRVDPKVTALAGEPPASGSVDDAGFLAPTAAMTAAGVGAN